jgi:hypothetical protein
MVPLVPVPSEFAGRVIVAKLGSAGILAELRGVSQIYPTLVDTPMVWVEATELADARELVETDTDDVLAPEAGPTEAQTRPGLAGPAARPLRAILVVIALVLLASLAWGTRSCSPSSQPTSARTP